MTVRGNESEEQAVNPNTAPTQAQNQNYQQFGNAQQSGQSFGQPAFGQQQNNPGFGGQSFRAFGASKISRSAGIEAVNKFNKIATEVIESNQMAAEYKLVLIPSEYTQVQLPVFAFYKTTTINGETVNVVRPIIYGVEQLPSRTFKPDTLGADVTVESAPGDIYTDRLWNTITEYLAGIGVKGIFRDACAYSVPYTFIPDEGPITVVMAVNATAIESYLAMAGDATTFKELSPEMFRNGRTEARLDFNPKPIFDSCGNPVRADWAVSVSHSENANQNGYNNNLDFSNNRYPIVNVYGYVDLIPVRQQQQFSPMNAWMTMAPPPYQPLIVITAIDTHMGVLTPGMVMLGLHAATAIVENYNYTRVFRPRLQHQGIPRNFGAIGYENPQLADGKAPAMIDVVSDDGVFFGLVGAALIPSPVWAIDIEETGDNNTVLQLFRSLAANDTSSQLASDIYLRSANHLTGGNFGSVAGAANLLPGEIATNDNNRIALASYSADNGISRDRRDVDHLAMLTVLGASDMGTVHQFDQTMNDTAAPAEVRLAANWIIVSRLVSTQAPTGYARRIILNGKFLKVNNDAIRSAGINVTVSGMQHDGQTQRGRDYAGLQNLQYQSSPGYFQNNFGYGNGGFNNGFQAFGARMPGMW